MCNWEKGAQPIPDKWWPVICEAIAAYTPPGPEVWFWPKVEVGGPDDCWPWKLSRWKRGYGYLRRGGKALTASRVAWELTHGPIPSNADGSKRWVLHRCDNPPCCNPAHLFLGDAQINVDDMIAKGRAWFSPGAPGRTHEGWVNGASKLTSDGVRSIRKRHAEGVTQTALAKEHGVTQVTVSKIVARKSWAHIE